MFLLLYWPTYSDAGADNLWSLFHSSEKPFFNLSYWSNRAYDKLVDDAAAITATDRKAAQAKYDQATKMLYDAGTRILPLRRRRAVRDLARGRRQQGDEHELPVRHLLLLDEAGLAETGERRRGVAHVAFSRTATPRLAARARRRRRRDVHPRPGRPLRPRRRLHRASRPAGGDRPGDEAARARPPGAEQFALYVRDLARGDWGTSLGTKEPVLRAVGERVLATLELVLVAMTIAVAVGIPLGVVAARRRGGVADGGARLVSVAGLSMPVFWLGLLLQVTLAGDGGLFPATGRESLEASVLHPVHSVTGLCSSIRSSRGTSRRSATRPGTSSSPRSRSPRTPPPS